MHFDFNHYLFIRRLENYVYKRLSLNDALAKLKTAGDNRMLYIKIASAKVSVA